VDAGTRWWDWHRWGEPSYWRLTVDSIELLGNLYGGGKVWMWNEARPGPLKHRFWACSVAGVVVGQVESKLRVAWGRRNPNLGPICGPGADRAIPSLA
jgi:hypothetical protein